MHARCMMGNGAQRARGVNLKQQEEWEVEDKLLALGKGSFLFPAEALRSSDALWVRGGNTIAERHSRYLQVFSILLAGHVGAVQ